MNYIYFMEAGTGNIKIGITNDVERRLKELKTADPDYHLVYKKEGNKQEETDIHNRFKELNVGGELFLPGVELLSFIHSLETNDENASYYYTTDLNQFVIDNTNNRSVSSNHVEKIKKSILRVGVRKEMPIIARRIEGKLFVVDGQHRLQAVRSLVNSGEKPHLGIWYIISDSDWDHQTTAITNGTQESWTMDEYFKLYVNRELPEYKKLKEFMDTYPMIPLTVALPLSEGLDVGFKAGNSEVGQSIKSGEFIFKNQEYAYEVGRMIADIHTHFKKAELGLSRFAQSAFITVINQNLYENVGGDLKKVEYDHERMVSQLEKHLFALSKKYDRRIDGFKQLFQDVYNYYSQSPVIFV